MLGRDDTRKPSNIDDTNHLPPTTTTTTTTNTSKPLKPLPPATRPASCWRIDTKWTKHSLFVNRQNLFVRRLRHRAVERSEVLFQPVGARRAHDRGGDELAGVHKRKSHLRRSDADLRASTDPSHHTAETRRVKQSTRTWCVVGYVGYAMHKVWCTEHPDGRPLSGETDWTCVWGGGGVAFRPLVVPHFRLTFTCNLVTPRDLTWPETDA